MKKILTLTLITYLVHAEEPLALNEVPIAESETSAELMVKKPTNLEIISLETASSENSLVVSPLEEHAYEQIESFFDAEKEVLSAEPLPSTVTPLEETPPLTVEHKSSLEVQQSEEALAEGESLIESDMQALENEVNGPQTAPSEILIDLKAVFSGSPTIYTLLMALSITSFVIWLYTLFSLRSAELMPKEEIDQIKEKLKNRQYEEALLLCKSHPSLLTKMVSVGLSSREKTSQPLLDLMNGEGKRLTASFWQKISLLNDIAMIAPMIGLLGTVMGMFYAFYDLNRSIESISALFDGLGISVGTTVCGLSVAILAMLFYSMTKYRLLRQLNTVENEARALAYFIETREQP